jgi:DNA repair protein RadB
MEYLPTGCAPIDEVLGGGFMCGDVTLIYGEATTGKTTLAASTVLHHLERDQWHKAYYIDSDGKLSTRRLTMMTGGEDDVLERLLIWTPKSFQEQSNLIESLPYLVPPGPNPLIVDSITGTYRLKAGNPELTFTSNKELNRQLGYLSEVAKTKGMAVIIIGQVHSVMDSETSEIEPVARRLLTYWADTILKLEITSVNGVRQAQLEKPTEAACRFRLSDMGVEEVRRTW